MTVLLHRDQQWDSLKLKLETWAGGKMVCFPPSRSSPHPHPSFIPLHPHYTLHFPLFSHSPPPLLPPFQQREDEEQLQKITKPGCLWKAAKTSRMESEKRAVSQEADQWTNQVCLLQTGANLSPGRKPFVHTLVNRSRLSVFIYFWGCLRSRILLQAPRGRIWLVL